MKIEAKPYFGPLPLFETALFSGLAIVAASYIYPTPYWLLAAIIVSWLYDRYFNQQYSITLKYDIGSPIKLTIRVSGLPPDVFDEINSTIKTNQLVKISCPNNTMLRKGLEYYVYNRLGFLEFQNSESFEVSSASLGKRTFLLSYRNKIHLQEAISHLQNRGWKLHESQLTESNLIDRVYTQTMIYEP